MLRAIPDEQNDLIDQHGVVGILEAIGDLLDDLFGSAGDAFGDIVLGDVVGDAGLAFHRKRGGLRDGAKLKGKVTSDRRQFGKTETGIKNGKITKDVVYIDASQEQTHLIAQADTPIDASGKLLGENGMVVVRCHGGELDLVEPAEVTLMDVAPEQLVSVATALIPFLEHDDANRALMGSNMMRQAVPLLQPHAPVVGTGVEARAARDSGQVVIARRKGVVTSVTADLIVVEPDDAASKKDIDHYPLLKFVRSNQGTCLNHRSTLAVGDRVKPGQVIADSMSTDQGELALGQNIVVAYMSWEGANYEDAIIISDRLVREDVFTSIHIEKHEIEARDTKLGPEEITRDIANVPEELLASLDENGIINVGAAVHPGDILVGKITPKGETEVTAEERLLRAIFGEKAREVKDSSLRLPHGERGTVVDVRVFHREEVDLAPGVNQLVRVSVAQKRKISVGDKMAGRHGNKGVVSRKIGRAHV